MRICNLRFIVQVNRAENKNLCGVIMIELIEEIRFCIQNNKLRTALGVALTLPDVCGSIEYKGQNLSVEKRYTKWCEKYLYNEGYTTITPTGEFDKDSGEFYRVIDPIHCYKLRCAYLHSGNAELNQRKNDDFPEFELRISASDQDGIYAEPYTKHNDKIKRIAVDVRHLCNVLCNTAELYYSNHDKSDFIEHSYKIVDVERLFNNWNFCKDKVLEIMNKKKHPYSYDELTEPAKKLSKELEKDISNLDFPEDLYTDGDVKRMISLMEIFLSYYPKATED